MVIQAVLWRALDQRLRRFRVASMGPRAVYPGLIVLLCGAAAAGCGGSGSAAQAKSHRATVAARVCARAQDAARPLLGSGVTLHIASSVPTNIECVLDGRGVSVDAIAQATAVAWTEYDTATVHQAQAYGSGALNERSQLPHPVPGMSGNAAWIPAKQQLLATNGTESRGGSYLTVTVTRHSPHAPLGLPVASAVGRAVLAAAPRGPNPGAPPS